MVEPYLPLPPALHRPAPTLVQSSGRLSSASRVCRHELDAAVCDVSFSPVAPYDVCATNNFSVSLIGSRAGTVKRTLERFREPAYAASYRPDGKLLVAAAGNGAKVFDLGSRAVLRKFTGHSSAVRTAKFTTDGRCVGTGSDDCTVKLWDLATAKCLTTLSEASDNVRSQAYSPSSRQVWLTGSHDRKIRLYDLRAPRCLFTLDHGAQVNDVHMLTGGARAVSIGGDFVRVWDFFAGGKVVHEVKGHAKMVTCGATSLGNGTFCTAGLDGMVKMHDMSTFEVKMRLKFEEGIWSMDACDDGVKVAVGLGNGVVEVRSRRRGRTWLGKDVKGKEREFEGVGRGVEKTWREKKGVKKGSYRWFERGKGDGVGDGDIVMGGAGFGDRAKLKEWEKKLKRFEYGDALQEVVNNGKLVEVVQVVEELRVRGALEDAMRRNDVEVGRRLVKAVRGGVGRGVRVTELVDLVEIVMDIWGEEIGKEETLETEVRRLREVVERQVQVGRELEGLRGMAEMLLGGNGDM